MSQRLRSTTLLAFAAALFLALLLVPSTGALAAPPRPIPGEFIVKYRKAVTLKERQALLQTMRAERVRSFRYIDAEFVRAPGLTPEQALQRFGSDPRIEYIEPNYEVSIDLTPNDLRFPELYGLRNTGQTGGTPGADIRAVNAWDLFTGDPNLKIGVIDTGVDYNHPDLAANVWTNPGEIPGNGVDDDGNGYVDDVHGYDFVNNDGDPFDDNGHGTHCAGTIAGVGNNSIGVVGVNWRASIVGIKFLSAGGSGSTAAAVSGVEYAITVGCRLTSNSWGGGGFSQALLDVINAAGAADQLFIAASGNSGVNTDTSPHYPSSYNTPYIIAVAATDHNDNLASFSNYGATTVDLAAPGVSILSCQPGGGYQLLSGTSMATPHVAGAVGLARGRFPAAGALQVKQLILNSVDVKSQLQGRVLTNGRLNAFLAIADPDETPPGQVADLATTNPSSNAMGLTWTATGDDGNVGRASSYEIRYSTSPITNEAGFAAATLVPGTPDPQPFGSAESFEVGGLDFSTTYYFALKARDEFGNAGPISNVATGTTLGIPNLAGTPASFAASLLTGGTDVQTLTLTNTGEGTLDFTIPTPELAFGAQAPFEPTVIGKGVDDWRVGDPVTDGAGGPDGFGYRWVDSNEPGGPAFAWVDITGVGTPLTLTGDDAWSAAVAMGMDFPFYGGTFNSLRVQTNGFLSFTETTGAYFDNQPLPTSGAPANMIAPFWDDQDFGATPRVWTHFDGTRFIVSWIGVPHYQTGGPYSYQAILYPTGEIVFQYLSMAAPLNSATVGIQNATKATGLNVAFNTNYVANDLAVRIVPLRQWLNVTPTAGRILAGQSQDLQVAFDATGLDGGSYDGIVHVLSNDPDGSPADFPASLQVTGAPDVAVNPASLDFGQHFVGATPTLNLTVSNPGTDVLDVTVASSDPTVTTDVTAFSLNPKAARNLVVTYAPVVPSVLAGTLTLSSNDPDTPNLAVPVSGSGVAAPAFSVSPDRFDVTLNTNTATSRTLTIRNTGGSDYVFTAEPVVVTPTGTVEVKGDADNVDIPKGGEDVQFGPAPLRAGGPDVFGYTFKDSDEPGGPTFAWEDIRAVGTRIPLSGDDVNSGPYPIGFSFPFYGNTFDTFRISTNGFVSFTSSLSALSNTSLPNTGSGVPENLLAAFWDDMNFGTVQRAYYHNDGTKLVIQYQEVPRFGDTSNPNTFEILLYPNGTIEYQYLDIRAATKNSHTIGIQNAQKNDGLQVVYNALYVKNGLAIRFSPPARFLTVTPTSGTVPPGGSANLTVGFNAAGLFGGLYQGAVHIAGNDPVLPEKNVPANLTVIGVTDVAVNPTSLDFGVSYIGYPQLRQIAVLNTGTDLLNVSSITFDNPRFGVDQSSFSVPPLGTAQLFVSFNANAVGPVAATMTIQSNDPDQPALAVPLSAEGLVAPDIRPDPASIAATVNIPGSTTRTLTVHNDGGSDLSFVVGTQITPTSVPVYASVELDKGQPDTRPGILGSGGPDAFGYRWRDSDEPGGPAFDWVDITGIGTPVPFTTGDDSNSQGIPIGFDFPFYGGAFNTVNVCTNGWLSFTNTGTNLTNNPLPGSGSPENLLAVFWDDLVPGTSPPRVYRYSDGTRFIVSYVGVPRFLATEPNTFQVILYRSGRIVYQYLDMRATTLNSATIGIQNGLRNDGLTVVYNNAYVHDGLAVEIATIPEYLTVTPTTGVVPPGGSLPLTVSFNTEGLFGGTYDGAVLLQSNDPDEPNVTVPTALDAIGTPDIAAAPPALDFGWLYLSQSRDLTVQVRNVGSDVLTLTGVGFTNPAYALVGTETFPIELGFNGAHTFTVRFAPTEACDPCAGAMNVASNDPDTPELAVALTGIGIVPPEIETAPESLRVALATTLGPTAIQATKMLIVENTGGSDLNWTAEALSALPASISVESAETGKDDPGAPGALGSGGPDAFGYRWADSDDPTGAPFEWIDITGIGTPLTLPGNGDDQNVKGIPIGFSFPFYGSSFDTVNVCTNGWLSFTSALTSLSNTSLPNTSSSAPENLIAAFWDDLDPDVLEPKIWVWGDATKFVVSYVNVPRFSSGGPYTFQVILYPSGTIDVQYLDMQGTRLAEATVGIQNGTKDIGLQVVYNAAYVKNNLRVRFSAQPGWLTVSPASGTTPAGGRDTLWVGANATGLADGDYEGWVRIASNDLDEPLTVTPVGLHVGVESARFELVPSTLQRSSRGRWLLGFVWPPEGTRARDIVSETVRLERQVPALWKLGFDCWDWFALYKFDRQALLDLLPDGDRVPVELIGRLGDRFWFQDTDYVRIRRPRVCWGHGGHHLTSGSSMPEQVTAMTIAPLQLIDPEGVTATRFELWYSPDAGESWSVIDSMITDRSFLWTIPAEATDQALLEVVAWDDQGLLGSTITNLFDIINGTLDADATPAPERFALRFAGRNPASRATLEFGLPTGGDVSVRIYDVRGALVREVASGAFEPGWHRLSWDGRTGDGGQAQPGVYFVQSRWNGQSAALRFVLLK